LQLPELDRRPVLQRSGGEKVLSAVAVEVEQALEVQLPATGLSHANRLVEPLAIRCLHEPARAGVAGAGEDDVVLAVAVHVGRLGGDVVALHRRAPIGTVAETFAGADMGAPAGTGGVCSA